MVSASKAPPAPDPYATAAAQTASNKETAGYQQALNSVNQVTPEGSLTYSENGAWSNGAPKYTATQTLTPAGQNIFDQQQQAQRGLATIANNQASKMNNLLGTNVNLGTADYSNEALQKSLFDLGSKRLTPQFAQDEEALRTRLSNAGIKEGSAAWNSEMGRLGQQKNDALDQLVLNGQSQAFNQALQARQQQVSDTLTERNQPINETTALMSGSQVQQPTYTNTPNTQVAGTPIGQYIYDSYNGQVAAANAKTQANNAMVGGLFGLAGGLGTAGVLKYSDSRLKTDARRVGTLDNGLSVWVYRYRDSDMPEMGLMADEVAMLKPEAVATDESGFLMVDYIKAVRA